MLAFLPQEPCPRARPSRRSRRAGWAGALPALLGLLTLSLPAVAAGRDFQLRWYPPADPDVAGYRVFLAPDAADYGPGMDIGFQPAGADDIASYWLTGLDAGLDYSVYMTAYNLDGLESVPSNEITIAGLVCDPSACDDGNPCTVDGCSGNLCSNDPAPAGTRCDDGDPGTVQDTCSAGVCSGVPPECSSDAECNDGNPCTADVCDPFSGCHSDPVANGTACNDGLFCTTGDSCTAGRCGGSPLDCSAFDDQCAVGACDEAAGRCIASPANEGLACDDGDACSVGETCSGGVCGGGAASFSDVTYQIRVDAADDPILDPSGGHDGVDLLGVLFDLDLAVDARGHVSGSGLATHALFSEPVPVMVKGRIRGHDGEMQMKLKLVLDAPDADPPVKGSVRAKFAIDVLGATYTQTAKLKVSAGDEKLALNDSSEPMPLAGFPGNGSDAGWSLLLDVQNLDGQRLDATASLALDAGAEFGLHGAGKLDAGGKAKMALRGVTKGLKLKALGLRLDPDAVEADAIQYTALGQSGTARASTATAVGVCEQ